MQYRGVLVDPVNKHNPTVQILSANLDDIYDWTVAILVGADRLKSPEEPRLLVSDKATVEIYQTSETLISKYDKTNAVVLRAVRRNRQGV